MFYVPVIDKDNQPLMPTTPNRAASWIRSRKATPFWKQGIWCVRLNLEPSARNLQPIACGIDTGSKKEAFTVKSDGKTFLNIQADAKTDVKDKVETRRQARRARRYRKTPYRKCRLNRKRGEFLPPSTKARWDWKLAIVRWLRKIFPITTYVVEDIRTKAKSEKKAWNQSFSPLQVGKKYFYDKISRFGQLVLKQGYETKTLRDALGLPKSKNKLGETFDSHCVDSWVLANVPFSDVVVEDRSIVFIKPLIFYRRQLHKFNPLIGGKRKLFGGTRSLGFRRGSLVHHQKYGITSVGGTYRERISLHDPFTNKRIYRDAKTENLQFICYRNFRLLNKNETVIGEIDEK